MIPLRSVQGHSDLRTASVCNSVSVSIANCGAYTFVLLVILMITYVEDNDTGTCKRSCRTSRLMTFVSVVIFSPNHIGMDIFMYHVTSRTFYLL
jgi:hypothetical protein